MKEILFSLPVIVLMSLAFAISCPAQTQDAAPEDSIKITLTIGEKVVPAILYNTAPARDLIARLPVTVSLNRGPVDYCGGIDPIKHGDDDLQAGYRSGDLAYWIPGQDFVIFIETKEASTEAPDLVILGEIRPDIKEIRGLGSNIKVTLALDK